MKYRIKFRHGAEFEFEADELRDDGNRLSLLRADGSVAISYIDSDIESCAPVRMPSIPGARKVQLRKAGKAVRTVRAARCRAHKGVLLIEDHQGKCVAAYRHHACDEFEELP